MFYNESVLYFRINLIGHLLVTFYAKKSFSMKKSRRINLNVANQSDVGEGVLKVRKVKKPSLPPKNDKELKDILDAVYDKNPALAYTLQMQSLSGLRYSDCSQLMFSDFYRNGQLVEQFDIIQQKTYYSRLKKMESNDKYTEQEKHRLAASRSKVTIYVTEEMIELLEACKLYNPGGEYLFANKNRKSQGFAMDIRSAEYHLSKVEIDLMLNYQLKTHSFRKMFAVKLLRSGVDVVKIRDLLGHSSLDSTNKYLSTISDELKQAVENLKYDF